MPEFYSVGFTGTQHGMTDVQKYNVENLLLAVNAHEFHHGDCIGADSEAHSIAAKHGIATIIHPPENTAKRAWCNGHFVLPPRDYLDRNKDIVDATDRLIAAPATDQEELRSGTWSTVRYARKRKKPIAIVLPDGDIKIENPLNA